MNHRISMTDHQANDIYQSLRIGIYIATEKPTVMI